MGVEKSEKLWNYLKETEYIDSKGRVQDSLRKALKENSVVLPYEFADHAEEIKEILRKLAGKLDIKNADKRKRHTNTRSHP